MKPNSPLTFSILLLYIHILTFKCVLISLLEIKSFVSLKNESLLFWSRVHFRGGVKFSKILREVAHKKVGEGGAEVTDLLKGVRSIFQREADSLEDTMVLNPGPCY